MTTTHTHRTGKNVEERKAQAEALHQSITVQVEQLRDSGRWQAFLDFAKAFHTYSMNNLLLILGQKPDATHVAGYRKWHNLGRQVRKGETGIRIFGYATTTITNEDDNDNDTQRTIPRYPVLTVFDISQTEPLDGTPNPATIASPLTGTDDHGVTTKLTTHLVAEGWNIHYRPLPGNQNGYTDPEQSTIVLDSGLSPEHTAKTLLHETAHIVLGHSNDPAEYTRHRGLMEVEAESVAYIVAGLTEFDTSDYSIGYITAWANADTNLIKSTATRVLDAAHRIADLV